MKFKRPIVSDGNIWDCNDDNINDKYHLFKAQCATHVLSTSWSNTYTYCLVSVLQMQFIAFHFTCSHFQGLLRTTLPHPKAERCYAQYEITQLLPGIELFSDRYRADICSVVASLYYVIRELHYAKQNLIVSPL